MLNIDQLAKGVNSNVRRVLEYCKEARLNTAINRRGYWGGKNHWRVRHNSEIPVEIGGRPYITWIDKDGIVHSKKNPIYWEYFDPSMDRETRRKQLYKFLRKYPEFKVVDKL